jgi:hypothetical protein
VCTWLCKTYGWCRSQWSLLHNICFHLEISEVVERTLFLVSGSVHCKFVHFVQQPWGTHGSETNVTCQVSSRHVHAAQERGNVLEDITLSRTSKSFGVGPIVYWAFVVCVHRRVNDSYKKKGICVYFVLENSRQFELVKHYYLSAHLMSYTTTKQRICLLALCW